MKFIYRTFDGTFTDNAQEMLAHVFGDYLFTTEPFTDAGIEATHRHTNVVEFWAFQEGEDFAQWCARCFPDDAIFEAE